MANIHHEYGMSRWTPWNYCAHFDSIPDSEAATKGKAAHDLLHRALIGEDVVIDESDMTHRAVRFAYNIIKSAYMNYDAKLYTEETVMIRKKLSQALDGIHGTVDAFFIADDGIHVYDFKTFSKSSEGLDLFVQLEGYAIGIASMIGVTERNTAVHLHVIHGGDFKVSDMRTWLGNCIDDGERVVAKRRNRDGEGKCSCHWCKYCKHSSSCGETQQEIDIVESGALDAMPIPQRLVLIEHLEGILAKAKKECKEKLALAPNKTIQVDDVAYGLITVNGASRMKKGKMLELYNACTAAGVKLEDLFDICTVGRTDLNKLLKAKCGLKLKSVDPSEVTAMTFTDPFYECGTVEKLERLK